MVTAIAHPSRRFVAAAALLAGLSLGSTLPDPPHEFHVSYGRLAVEGKTAVLQIRLFKDDLEAGLRGRFGDPGLTMRADPVVDSLFTLYLNEHLVLTPAHAALRGTIVSSGEELMNGFPVWWYTVAYTSDEPIGDLHIRHDMLMEVFPDQKNVFKIKHFPSEEEWSLYFVAGDSDYALTFG
jgi:hypothetical protein